MTDVPPCPACVPTCPGRAPRTRVPVSLSIDTGHGHALSGAGTDAKVCPAPSGAYVDACPCCREYVEATELQADPAGWFATYDHCGETWTRVLDR